MTDQGQTNSNPKPVEVNVTKPASQGIGSKIAGGLSWWIGSLTGKPPKKAAPVQQPGTASSTGVPATGQPSAEDSVSQDLEKLRGLIGKISTKVQKDVAPVVEKGVESAKGAGSNVINKVEKNYLKTILRIFFIILLIIILVFIGLKFLRGGGGNATPTSTPTPTKTLSSDVTPSITVFNPPKRSIYADDETVLKLEEGINVITREAGSRNLKETQLNPPVLDFNVTF